MSSYQSKTVRFLLQHRHWLRGKTKPEIIDRQTSVVKLRENAKQAAAKMAKLPQEVQIIPTQIDGVYAEWISTNKCPAEDVILYFHGGGFVMGSCAENRNLVAKFVHRCGTKALMFDYSLAPEHPYPAAIHDSVAAYHWLLRQGYLPQHIVFAGDSAGGGLLFGTMLKLKDHGLPLPKAAVAFSPCTDVTHSGESHTTKLNKDPVTPQGSTETYLGYYIGENNPKEPYASPLFGDLHGLPPIMIQVGEDETLLSDAVDFAKKASLAGVDVTIHIWPGMFHCFPLLAPMFPEATAALEEVCVFIKRQLNQ